MQRRLIVMRHAKSSWDSGASGDHARPLNPRGRRDAPRVARHLAELGWTPDRVWSSTSQRTTETWELMAPELREGLQVTFDRRLYLAGLGTLQEVASEWPEDARTLLVLGHNPGWEDAASQLSGSPISMTTANAVLLEGEGSTWAEALERSWTLHQQLRPRELPQ